PSQAWESATEWRSAGGPGLCDQVQLAQFRISRNFTEYGSVSPVERSVRIAAEYRRQIKAESVDMHFLFPITQAVHHHLAHVRLAEIQGVARPGVIGVRVSRVGGQHVIAGCIQTLEAVDRSSVVALAGVVVHDVEHYPDTCTM